jgi:hypothetical protein
VGALQAVLARRVVAAAWRLERAERLEVELFAEHHLPGRSLGLALIRDGNGARSFDTLLRYRGGTLAELWRALRTLKALQAEESKANAASPHTKPIEPEARGNPRETVLPPDAGEPDAAPGRRAAANAVAARGAAPQRGGGRAGGLPALAAREKPIEPEAHRIPRETPLLPADEPGMDGVAGRCDAGVPGSAPRGSDRARPCCADAAPGAKVLGRYG